MEEQFDRLRVSQSRDFPVPTSSRLPTEEDFERWDRLLMSVKPDIQELVSVSICTIFGKDLGKKKRRALSD
jgi:hypothetical protein